MADLAAEVIPPRLRDWLALHRAGLNGRFRAARRRFPRLEPGPVLALCRELLPPLAGDDDPGGELLSAVYDLILLHAGRSLLGPRPAGAQSEESGLGVLLREAFPRLRRFLRAWPRRLPGALSNAVENLGPRGLHLARTLAGLAEDLADPQQVLDAGAVLAWRLGEARLRQPALALARQLPPHVALTALGMGAQPAESLPGLLAALEADAWRMPSQKKRGGWALTARLGDFLGFGGAFEEPPVLLDPGPGGSRHRFFVRSGGLAYCLDADLFGCVCRPVKVDLPPCPPPGRKPALPELAGTTSVLTGEDLIACTRPDSFRVRLLTR